MKEQMSDPLPMNRQERQACWDSRDKYFACLDDKNVVAAGQEGKACLSDRRAFEKDCARSWIDYFTKRRVLEARQKMTQAQSSNAQGSAATGIPASTDPLLPGSGSGSPDGGQPQRLV